MTLLNTKPARDAAHAFTLACVDLNAIASPASIQEMRGVHGVDLAARIDLSFPEFGVEPQHPIGRVVVGLLDGKVACASFEPLAHLPKASPEASNARGHIMNQLGEFFALWTRNEALANALGDGDPVLNARIENRRIQEMLRDASVTPPRF